MKKQINNEEEFKEAINDLGELNKYAAGHGFVIMRLR